MPGWWRGHGAAALEESAASYKPTTCVHSRATSQFTPAAAEMKIYVHTKTCTWRSQQLDPDSPKLDRSQRLFEGERLRELWSTHAVEHHSAIKRNELSIQTQRTAVRTMLGDRPVTRVPSRRTALTERPCHPNDTIRIHDQRLLGLGSGGGGARKGRGAASAGSRRGPPGEGAI